MRNWVQLPALKLSAWQDLQYAYMDLACTRKLFGAAVLINGGSSDDRFLDFTAWLVMQGKTVYESALAAPDSLAQFDLPLMPPSGSSAGTLRTMRIPASGIWPCSRRTPRQGSCFASVTRNGQI